MKKGDYVVATVRGLGTARSGIYLSPRRIFTESGELLETVSDARRVPDSEIAPSTAAFLRQWRAYNNRNFKNKKGKRDGSTT